MSIPAALFLSVKFGKNKGKLTILRPEYAWLAGSTAMVLGLFLLNYARFGSVTDFGLTHQNPQVYEYLRNQVRLFSPEAKVWDLIFKLASYYGSPAIVKISFGNKFILLGRFPSEFILFQPAIRYLCRCYPVCLVQGEKEWIEAVGSTDPDRFHHGLFEPTDRRSGHCRGYAVFRRVYLLPDPVLFHCNRLIVSLQNCIFITALMISVYLPSNILSFVNTRPELRLLDMSRGFQGIIDATRGSGTFFIERDVVWFKGSVSAETFQRSRRYNTVGISPASGGFLQAMDIAAAYIIPDPPANSETQRTLVSIKRLACHSEGAVAVFIDGRLVGRMDVETRGFCHAILSCKFPIEYTASRQVLLAFFPDKQEYLSYVPPGRPALIVREIELRAAEKTGARKI